MKIPINCILLSIYFIIGLHPASAKETGWILTQRTKLLGDQYVYISTHGVKCINPKQGIGWITQTPNWNITFFNEKTKLYYPLSSSSWKTKIAKNGLIPSNIKWSKISTGSVAGLKASQYKMVNSASSNGTQSTKWLSATYWLADEINVPASLAQLISSACGLPASDSIPLELSYCNQKGNTETLLKTYHKQIAAIPDSYFSSPAGYKIARSEVEVLVSKENRALIDELANDITSDNLHTKINPQLIDASKQISPESINKLPNQVNLPGGRTISKDQINKFLNRLKTSN
jgi:hypothetical protein